MANFDLSGAQSRGQLDLLTYWITGESGRLRRCVTLDEVTSFIRGLTDTDLTIFLPREAPVYDVLDELAPPAGDPGNL